MEALVNDIPDPDGTVSRCPSCGTSGNGILGVAGEGLNRQTLVCDHPWHQPPGNYTSIITREGDGADAGGQADPLVQEPNE